MPPTPTEEIQRVSSESVVLHLRPETTSAHGARLIWRPGASAHPRLGRTIGTPSTHRAHPTPCPPVRAISERAHGVNNAVSTNSVPLPRPHRVYPTTSPRGTETALAHHRRTTTTRGPTKQFCSFTAAVVGLTARQRQLSPAQASGVSVSTEHGASRHSTHSPMRT